MCIRDRHFLKPNAVHIVGCVAAFFVEHYSIYQLDLSDSTDDLRFMSLDWLEKKGLPVDKMCIRDSRCFVFAAARDQFGCDQPVLSERAFL